MLTWRLVKTGLRYWSVVSEYATEGEARLALVAYNQSVERRARITRKGREPRATHRVVAMATNWETDQFPDAVFNRIQRLKAE